MATYTFIGYAPTAFIALGGSDYMLDPAWDSATDGYTFVFTDDDPDLSGDLSNNEVGDDANQSAVVTDALGNPVASGRVYIEDQFGYVDKFGATQAIYAVEIAGVLIGYIGTQEVQPGVVCTLTSLGNVTSVPYANIASNTYSPSDADTIQGSAGADSIAAGDQADSIEAGDGADTIDGGAGNDTIYYGDGGDSVSGGDGDDLIDDVDGIQLGSADTIDGGAGNDSIYAGLNTDLVYGGTGNDWIAGEGGNDTLYGGDGNDTVLGGDGEDLIYGEAGSDSLRGDAGNDTIYGGADNDQIYGGTGGDLLYGDAGTDVILGDADNDTIFGGDGGDYLAGNAGSDSLEGGADGDIFFFEDGWGNDTVLGGNTVTTGSDNDFLNFTYLTATGVTVTFSGWEDGTASDGGNAVSFDNIEGLTMSAQADSVDAALDGSGLFIDMGGGADTVGGGSGDDTIYGGAGDDTIWGAAGADYIEGGDGSDTLQGADGDDTIWGGAGVNTIMGDAGQDVLIVTGADGQTSAFGGEGGSDWDTLQLSGAPVSVTWGGWEFGSFTYDGGVTTHNFYEIEYVTGTTGADTFDASSAATGVNIAAGDGADTVTGSGFADSIAGEGGNDSLTGGAGADTLDGGAGDDILTGGTGDDVITTGTGADTIVMADGDGSDTITDFDMTDSGGFTVDQLDVSGLTTAGGDPIRVFDVVVSDDGSGNAVLSFPGGEQVTLTGVTPAQVSSTGAMYSMGVPCLAEGTLVDTPKGVRPVDSLAPGDLVRTRDGPPQRVLWAGFRDVTRTDMLNDPRLFPVLIGKGALGNLRPLRVSAQHCVWVPGQHGGALVRARHMSLTGWGGARIMRGCQGIRYYHILLEEHALIRAEGAWVESFWPGPGGFAAVAPALRMHLLGACPALAEGLLGLALVEPAYGPQARPVLHRRDVTETTCLDWSSRLRRRASARTNGLA
ncbi:Hint domain-containing protein [Tropicibacter naphthalenivorans]|uniref:Cyclolysin n=1 Tax=Tropicibacter naphthalenivorans TaxID=441103 RepID=A0A0P1GWP5_9RHOB|nr:Hint domain-containing protein [Tropicibacter naphthalenivorans]CUH81261.1 Cyclolysin [Tropicibacter naphthalenivorans]SMC98017.1 Ca2+-binding protein, RTX toxin-related [Tropicibacter naphthalenivorans]